MIKSHWIVFVTLKKTGDHWNILTMEHYIIVLTLLIRVCLCVRLSVQCVHTYVCLSVCLNVCLYVCIVCMSVCPSVCIVCICVQSPNLEF